MFYLHLISFLFLFFPLAKSDEIFPVEEALVNSLLPAIDRQDLGWIHGCVHVISGRR